MEDDFGDFSSAFPSNETSKNLDTSNSGMTGDVVFDPGHPIGSSLNEQGAKTDDIFTSNWGFDDFPAIPFQPSMHIEATALDIHTLPDDFQLEFTGGDAFETTGNTEQTTYSQSIAAQQPHNTAVSCAEPNKMGDDFGDFESSSVQAELCNVGNLGESDEWACNSSMALHNFPGTSNQSASPETLPAGDDGDEFGQFETAAVTPPCTSSLGYASTTSDRNECSAAAAVDSGYSGTISMSSPKVFMMSFTGSNVGVKSAITECGPILNFRWLSRLKNSVDFTVPLYKWDASCLQSSYYTSIKVDPLLVTKVDMTSVLSVLPTTEGQSAALDLMESFGFEGGFEPSSPTDPDNNFLPSTSTKFQRSNSGPTLLDLSLPNSPLEDLQKDSFTLDADLQDLDLHSTEAERQSTSIEQLILNERLVVNRTTWMDSELEQLGDGAVPALQPPSTQTEQYKEVAGNASFHEQMKQLGLDTSKTTLAATPSTVTEMSISARLIFDRLPNLSFMLQDTLVAVDHHSY